MKKINLNSNFTLVSNEDYDHLNQFKWYLSFLNKEKSLFYAKRTDYSKGKKNRKTITLHRYLMSLILKRKLKRNEFVDHINGNSLDNRRENLRIVTHKQSNMNRAAERNSISKYKGVCPLYNNSKKPWRAYISINRKQKHLGCFKNEIDAAKAYDREAKKLFGDFARLNFGSEI